MDELRTGFSTGHSHFIDEATGGPLCHTRVANFEEGVVGPDGVSCSKCRALAPLKPCPFCGQPPRFMEKQGWDSAPSIWCGRCNVNGPDRDGDSHFGTKLEIVEAWNRRGPSPADQEGAETVT